MQHITSNIKRYGLYTIPVLSLIGLIVVLNQTNPLDVGPAGILLVFGVVYIFMASTLYLLLTLAIVVMAYFVSIPVVVKKKLYYVTSVVAFAPVFLLALNSIGQLEIKDFVLVIALVGIACFYIIRRR